MKQAANEEMVKTAELGDSIGAENATALIAKVKEEMAKNPPENRSRYYEQLLKTQQKI